MSKKPITFKTNVFILDDDQNVLEVISEMVKELGFTPATATGINEARFKLTNQLFQYLILDYNIGTQNTEKLIQEIKATGSKNSKAKIILISGDIDKEAIVNLKEFLYRAILKPVTKDQLELLLEVVE